MASSTSGSSSRIGYLVPEFPAQTHIFFWREANALKELGIDPVFISTRRPDPTLMSHDWCQAVAARTHYLAEGAFRSWARAGVTALQRAGGLTQALAATLQDTERGAIRTLASAAPSALLAIRLVETLRNAGLSHVHVGSCGRSAEIASIAARISDITYSLSMLGPRFATYGQRHKFKWAKARFGLFQSRQLLDEATSILGECMPALAAVAPVGVDTERMRRNVPYVPWTPGSTCRLYTCGRLNPIKGHEDVIAAVSILRKRGLDARLRIGGEDERGGRGYRRTIESYIETSGMRDFVQLLGAVSESQNFIEYQSAHVYVMGSLNEAAGAVAAMEAMSLEVPVVMPGTGATPELISHGTSGLLVSARSPNEIADAIQALLGDQAFAERIRAAGRSKILDEFSHRRSALAIKGFLEQSHNPTRDLTQR